MSRRSDEEDETAQRSDAIDRLGGMSPLSKLKQQVDAMSLDIDDMQRKVATMLLRPGVAFTGEEMMSTSSVVSPLTPIVWHPDAMFGSKDVYYVDAVGTDWIVVRGRDDRIARFATGYDVKDAFIEILLQYMRGNLGCHI